MANQQSTPDLMASAGKIRRDSTRILSNLSGDSRVMPARAKSAPSRNKMFASLTGLIVLTGVLTWLVWLAGLAPFPVTSRPFVATNVTTATTQTETPTQTAADPTTLAMSGLSDEPQVAQIENLPDTDESKSGVTSLITSSLKPFAVLTGETPQSEKTTKTDQELSIRKTAKKGSPVTRPRTTEDDADVNLLTALIQNTESPDSAEKTPEIAERLKGCQKLRKKEAAHCRQSFCKGQAGKNSACQVNK